MSHRVCKANDSFIESFFSLIFFKISHTQFTLCASIKSSVLVYSRGSCFLSSYWLDSAYIQNRVDELTLRLRVIVYFGVCSFLFGIFVVAFFLLLNLALIQIDEAVVFYLRFKPFSILFDRHLFGDVMSWAVTMLRSNIEYVQFL